jgi:hypothetical protein
MGLFGRIVNAVGDDPFYPFDPDLMYSVCIEAGAKMGWLVLDTNATARTISFRATDGPGLVGTLLGDGDSDWLETIYVIAASMEGKPGSRLNTPTLEFGAAVNGVLITRGLIKDGEFIDPDARPPRKSPAPTVGKNPFSGSNQDETASRSAPPSAESVADELKAVTDLHKSGALSDEEFAAAKRKILGSDT